jgi:hypothetical protein
MTPLPSPVSDGTNRCQVSKLGEVRDHHPKPTVRESSGIALSIIRVAR